jgi:hypothetical protein
MGFYLNIIGLCCGMLGTVLIYLFGVPRQIDNSGFGAIILEQPDMSEVARIRRYRRLGNTGLALVFAAFALQLTAIVAT